MKILDKYIIKQFLKSFFFMFLLFIPIGILVDVSEKIDKFKEHDLGFYSWIIKKTKEKILDGDFDRWKNTLVKKLDNKL